MSLQSKVFRTFIRASGRKHLFASEGKVRQFVTRHRPVKESKPPHKLESRFNIGCDLINDRPIYYLQQKSGNDLRHIVYVHGGSYIQKMMRPHWTFIHRLAGVYPCSVSVPLYGLAPEYNYRDAFALLDLHYRELLETHSPEDIVLMGDSAGGGLALAFAQSLIKSDLPQVGQVVMLSPWLDITLSNPDISDVISRDPVLDVPGNQEAGRMWSAGTDPKDPNLSPLYGPLKGLPPLCLFIGTDDILMPDARLFHEKARAGGQSLEYHEYPSLFHLWMFLPMPEANSAISEIMHFLEQEFVVEPRAVV